VGPGNATVDAVALVGATTRILVVKSEERSCGSASRLTLRLSGPSSSQIVCTTVLKPRVRDENSWNDGSAEIGVCVVDLVVGTTVARSESEGIGPVTVGYMPVQ
jgi:hypothetical protein